MAIGDIGAVIDTLEFDAAYANMPSVCHVSGNIYAIAYWGPASVGMVCTVSIDPTGVMPATVKDSWAFDAVYGSYPEILKVYETIYAIVYTDSLTKGQLVTLSIANDGTITEAIIDSGQFSADLANPEHFIEIASNILCVVYADGSAHGWVQTFDISNAGFINDIDVSHLEFDGVEGREGFICHVAAAVYAIAYRGPGDDGWLCTVSISDVGLIAGAVLSTLEFDASSCVEPSIVNARANYFAVAYAGPGADGWMKIIEISPAGVITDPPVDSYEFDIIWGLHPWLYALGNGYLAVTYCRSGNPLWCSTFLVDGAGSLNATTLDTQVIDAGISTYSILFNRAGDYFAVVYSGPGSNGWIKTFTIKAPVLVGPHHELIMGIGP